MKANYYQNTQFGREFQALPNGIIAFSSNPFFSVKRGQKLCPTFAFQENKSNELFLVDCRAFHATSCAWIFSFVLTH
jgi:hypothetical protein